MTEVVDFFPGIARAWDDPRFKVVLTAHEKIALCSLAGVSELYATTAFRDLPPHARVKIIKACRAAVVLGRELSIAMLFTP